VRGVAVKALAAAADPRLRPHPRPAILVEDAVKVLQGIAFLATAVGVPFALYRYFDSRKLELAWKRTEFLFAQAQHLDSDESIQLAVNVLAGRDRRATVHDVFGPRPSLGPLLHERYISSFERLLNFLDRLAYAVLHVESLTMQEVANFGWHYRRVRAHACLVDYCETQGFPDVVRLAPKLQDYLEQNYGPDEVAAPMCPHLSACAATAAASIPGGSARSSPPGARASSPRVR